MKNERLTPERKLELVQGLLKAKNVKQYAEEVGVDRSYLYELKREMDQACLEKWASIQPGRPSNPPAEPTSAELEQAQEERDSWQVRALTAEAVLKALQELEEHEKKEPHRPIFLRG